MGWGGMGWGGGAIGDIVLYCIVFFGGGIKYRTVWGGGSRKQNIYRFEKKNTKTKNHRLRIVVGTMSAY